MRRSLAVLAALILTACGRAAPPTSQASTSATAQRPSPTPTARSATATFDLLPPASGARSVNLHISCNHSIGGSDSVAIVQLHDGSTVMRDYADVAHPYTACTFGPGLYLSLIDAHHVVATDQGPGALYAVVDLPEARPHWFQLPSQTGIPTFLAVAPGLDAVAWMTPNLSANTDEVHITTHSGDSLVASLPNPHAGRCGSPDDSKTAEYRRSANDFFVLDQPAGPWNSLLIVRNGQAALRLAPTDRWPTGAQPEMALWSPISEALYYRKDGSVWRWTPTSGPSQFLPNVSWYYPTISADGRYLAYAVAESTGLHDVYLMDLRSGGGPRKIGNGNRTTPAFLDATQLWFKSENLGPCGPGGNQPLVYDLADGTESPTIVETPISVWPATSANF